MVITSLSEALDWTRQTLAAHPELNGDAARRAALDGKKRNVPAFYLGMWNRPDDPTESPAEWTLPTIAIRDPQEAALAARAVGLAAPLTLGNPYRTQVGVDFGTGTLAASFGARLIPEFDYAVGGELTLDEALAQPEPDLETAGVLPIVRERIRTFKEAFPDWIKIAPPNVQGPFNIAHAVLGTNVFYAPFDEPEKFRELMRRITRHWIGVQRSAWELIGPGRLADGNQPVAYLAECSVNLVSTDFYKEFILEHDHEACSAMPRVHLHPCSGAHVFHVTWENLPNLVVTEAGTMEHRMAAGAIPVQEALAAIGDRPVVLSIGQELPEGNEFNYVARDFDRYPENPRLLFGYTGTHFLKRDCGKIRDLHKRLDDYFAARL